MPYLEREEKERPWKIKKEPKKRNPTSNQALYRSARWQLLTKRFRKMNPLCELCLISDMYTDVTPGNAKGVTDHIIRVDSMGGAKYDDRNLCALCRECHDRKSNIESRGGFDIEYIVNEYNELIPSDKEEALLVIHAAINRIGYTGGTITPF